MRVGTGPGKAGKTWNFVLTFSGTGISWKKTACLGKPWIISLTQAMKFSEFMLKEMHVDHKEKWILKSWE